MTSEILQIQANSRVVLHPKNIASSGRIRSIEPKHSQNTHFKYHLASNPEVHAESPSPYTQIPRVYSTLLVCAAYRACFVLGVLRVLGVMAAYLLGVHGV